MLEVRAVGKQYASGRGHIMAIQDINFTLESASSLTLAGSSGSGKTTLLNCLGTLEIPDQGEIVYNDVVVSRLSASSRTNFRRTAIGFVFQDRNLLPWLNVAENLAFPLMMAGVSKKDQGYRVSELLEIFSLSGYEKALAGELSGGESQRIAFARAVVHKPALLLADEPTASLDSKNGRQLINLMFSLCRQQGTMLVLATHDRELLDMSKRVVYLRDGKMEDINEHYT